MKANGTQKRALLIIYNAAHFRELLRVARILRESSTYKPLLVFVSPYPGLDAHYQQCLSLGLGAVIRGQPLPRKKSKWLLTIGILPSTIYNIVKVPARRVIPQFIRKIISLTYRILARHYLACWNLIKESFYSVKSGIHRRLRSSDALLVHTLRAIKESRYASKMCRDLSPDIIVLAEDNVEYLSGAWVRAAHRKGIPVLIVPYCLAGIEEPAAVYLNDPKHHADNKENQSFARDFPHWVYEYQGRRLVRLPAKRALPMEWLGISSPLPWIMNGSCADAIAVESEFMRNFYKRQGLPPRQLVTVGAVSDDVLYATLQDLETQRRRLYLEFGMREDKPMLLCALPPVTSAMNNIREEFDSYEEMIRFWIDSVRQIDDYNVFISLHPTMDRTQFQWLQEIGWWGIGLTPPDTAVMIALCDIYIASVSSTIRWAIACGKPVINYDVYKFRFPDFKPARGVVSVETKEEFISALRRITEDRDYYQSLREAQIQCSSYWGMIDGQSGKRLLALIDSLVRQFECRKTDSQTRMLRVVSHWTQIKSFLMRNLSKLRSRIL